MPSKKRRSSKRKLRRSRSRLRGSRSRSRRVNKIILSDNSKSIIEKASRELIDGKDPNKVRIDLEKALSNVPDNEKISFLDAAEKTMEDPYRVILLIGMATTLATGAYALVKGLRKGGKWIYKKAMKEESIMDRSFNNFNEGGRRSPEEVVDFINKAIIPFIPRNKTYINKKFNLEIMTNSNVARALSDAYIRYTIQRRNEKITKETFVPLLEIPSINRYFSEIRKIHERERAHSLSFIGIQREPELESL